ncbi:hypothetical protein AMK01_PC00147 (plasmid) [Rhizobium sp. N6212]|nr:hypothetical protein AMK01_PC00147 [Rhizobium sp. N6212]
MFAKSARGTSTNSISAAFARSGRHYRLTCRVLGRSGKQRHRHLSCASALGRFRTPAHDARVHFGFLRSAADGLLPAPNWSFLHPSPKTAANANATPRAENLAIKNYVRIAGGRPGRRPPIPCGTSDRVRIPASSAARRSTSRNCSGAIFPVMASTQALTAAIYSSPSSQGQSFIRRRAASPNVHTILRDFGPRKANPTGVNADDVFQHIIPDPSTHGYFSPHVQCTRVFGNLELKFVVRHGLNANL